jgi:CheY-specific phosphatase CheX
VVMEEFNVDISKYTATLKQVIAACMDGVEPEEIINMVISSVTASGERVTGQRALQEGGDSINVSYEVQTNGEDMSYSSLSEQLTTAVTSGEFDTIMGQTATENGATGLDEATSDTVTTQPASEDLVLFYVEQVRICRQW